MPFQDTIFVGVVLVRYVNNLLGYLFSFSPSVPFQENSFLQIPEILLVRHDKYSHNEVEDTMGVKRKQ